MVHTSKLIVWLIALLLIVGGGYFLYSYFYANRAPLSELSALWQLKRDGNNQAVLAQYQHIQADPNKSAQDKANAALFVTGVQFSVSGDSKDLIQEVQKMKSIITDSSLDPSVRAYAMSVLGNEYSVSGRNVAVFNEIYKDAPFNAYLVAGSQALSGLNLEKASYEIKPTSYAAIKVADIATGQYFANPHQAATTTASYVAEAEEYLKKADTAVIDEVKRSPTPYQNSDGYILYQLSRAIVVGRLAVEKGDPYTSQYQQGFESFITAAQTGHSTLSKNSLLDARYQYATVLAALKDAKNEKSQLDLLAKDMNSSQDIATSDLVLSMKSAYKSAPTGALWKQIKAMMAVSPDFAAAVSKYVTASTQ